MNLSKVTLERLGIKKFTENKDEWIKFYGVFGPDCLASHNERREVFDFIICPDLEPIGEELARNTLKYSRLLESKSLDASKGSHILIVNVKLFDYEGKISSEEEEKLYKKYPGCFYVPVVERRAAVRKFMTNVDRRKNGRFVSFTI
ncbi:hypothetical protein GLOIN_2v1777986 [Rhizophagus clarus]|uniref:Uncharacterized protein n=1 Tax=Rhizophagus clarus TaxID=94130 RepID=A0A8H3MGS6_9GLOM|nr:hypothetical protein GLOIN_2v1777986 [Rhizophagus clarus]